MNRAEDLHDMGIMLINRIWRSGMVSWQPAPPPVEINSWLMVLHDELSEVRDEIQGQ